MDATDKCAADLPNFETSATNAWVKPAILSFEPVKAAEGISYNPNDGIANLTA